MTTVEIETYLKNLHIKLADLVTAGDITQIESNSIYPVLVHLRLKNETIGE